MLFRWTHYKITPTFGDFLSQNLANYITALTFSAAIYLHFAVYNFVEIRRINIEQTFLGGLLQNY